MDYSCSNGVNVCFLIHRNNLDTIVSIKVFKLDAPTCTMRHCHANGLTLLTWTRIPITQMKRLIFCKWLWINRAFWENRIMITMWQGQPLSLKTFQSKLLNSNGMGFLMEQGDNNCRFKCRKLKFIQFFILYKRWSLGPKFIMFPIMLGKYIPMGMGAMAGFGPKDLFLEGVGAPIIMV